MTDEHERAELLAALYAAGASSEEDERELQRFLANDPDLKQLVHEFEESIAALASSYEPLETSPATLRSIKTKVSRYRPGLLQRLFRWLSRT